MPMDKLYGFNVVGNVPTNGVRERMEQESQAGYATVAELSERVTMLETENNAFREQLKALEKEVRMLANKVTTL